MCCIETLPGAINLNFSLNSRNIFLKKRTLSDEVKVKLINRNYNFFISWLKKYSHIILWLSMRTHHLFAFTNIIHVKLSSMIFRNYYSKFKWGRDCYFMNYSYESKRNCSCQLMEFGNIGNTEAYLYLYVSNSESCALWA